MRTRLGSVPKRPMFRLTARVNNIDALLPPSACGEMAEMMIEMPDGTLCPCTEGPSVANSSTIDNRTRAALNGSVMDGLYNSFDARDPLSQLTQVAQLTRSAATTTSGATNAGGNIPLPHERGTPPTYPEFTHWPVPGYRSLNQPDKPREGAGEFGTSRGGGVRTHTGIDIQAPVGTPVVAIGSGTVIRADGRNAGGYGNQLVIDHGNSRYSQYAHLQNFSASQGQQVTGGDTIGYVGLSGNSPGDAHLHFEIRLNSPAATSTSKTTVVIDPMAILP